MKAIFKPYDRHDGPGCAVAVISSGRVIFTKGYGMANLEYDIPITPTTIFDIASVSKQFTGWAISTLIQEGKVSPDDEIHKYLPDLPSFGTPITIRHLLHHISGIRDWPQTLNAAGWRWDEVFSFTDIMRMVKYQKDLDFPPGTRYSYSNTAYNLLAAIIEKVTGKSFRDWTDQRIFGPLGMPSSHFLDDPDRIIRNLAYSYTPGDAGFRKDPDALTAYGSSSLFTSVDDLCKWVIHFQEAVRTKDPVVTRMLDDGILNDGTMVHYGYGLGLGEDRGLKNISHTGGWAGYRTIISNYPDQDLSIIILSNASDFDPTAYAARVADLFLAGKFAPTTTNGTENLQALPTVTVSPQLLAKYAGTYQLGPGWAVTLTVENNGLMTQANGEDKFPMEAKSDSVFWIRAYGSSMTFVKGPDGKVDSLHYRSIHANKITPWHPRPGQLTEYFGTYYSEELATDYTIDTAGGHGQLMMHQRRLGDIALTPDPTAPDQFDNSIGIFLFVRDGQHGVTGFRLSGGRVKNLRFDKITRTPIFTGH
jgi:CubicO group peptidase (beta-lactamase class C family)